MFLDLKNEGEYKKYYFDNYCRMPLTTHDGIQVFFGRDKFDHAFYESTNRDGVKDVFSLERARRITFIGDVLTNPNAVRYQGYIKRTKQYDPARMVGVTVNDFVVVVKLGLKANGDLRGNFVTCYYADNSIAKIRRSPLWDRQTCIDTLKK